MIQALQDALRRKTAYRRVFLADTDEARLVLRDIMRQVIPRASLLCPGKQDVTNANCGAHSLAVGILRTIYSSDEELKKQIEELYRQENQQP